MTLRDLTFGALFCLIAAPVLWGGNFVVGSLMADDLPGLWTNLFRWLMALAVLTPLCIGSAWRYRRDLVRHGRRLAVLGLLGVTGFNSVLYIALHYASVSMAAIAFAVTPFLIVGITAVTERTWPRPRIITASLIALSGMVLAQGHALTRDVAPIGVGLVLCAALIWAGYCVALRHAPAGIPPKASFFGQIVLGTVFLAPLTLLAPAPDVLISQMPRVWLGVAYLGLGAGALAFWLWQHAIAKAGPVRASLFMNLVPISSMALGALILGEDLTRVDLVAFGIVLIGIALSVTGQPDAKPAVPEPEAVPEFESVVAARRVTSRSEALPISTNNTNDKGPANTDRPRSERLERA